MRYWQPLGAKTAVTCSLPHLQNECQRRVNNFWFSIYDNQGIARRFKHIEELSTALMGKTIIYERTNTDSKIIDIATCQKCKNILLAVESTILISHYFQTAKSRALYESIDGRAGWPTYNPPNRDRLRDFHQTVPELPVRVYWQPGLRVWRQFGLDLDPKWRSRTVANTNLNLWRELLKSQQHCSVWIVAVPSLSALLSLPPPYRWSSIPIGAPLAGLVLLYNIPHYWPAHVSALLCQYGCSSNPISTPQPRFGTLLFYSTPLQHLLCTSLFHTALPIWHSSFAGSCSPFHPNISYCLSNPHLDSQLAHVSLHLC